MPGNKVSFGRPGIKYRLTEADKLLSESDYKRVCQFFLERVRWQRPRKGPYWALGKRDYVFVRTLAETGLRASEAENLRWEDVHSAARPAFLVARGGKWRKRAAIEADSIFFGDDLAELLEEWESIQRVYMPGTVGPFFDISRRRAWQIVKRAVRALQLNPRISPHTFRHYAITSWCRVPGASPYAVAKQARLRSVELVLHYFHSSPAAQAELVKGR